MPFVVAVCKHIQGKFCKNWDGQGDPNPNILKSCPSNHKDCQYLVTPKPSPELKP